MTELPEGAADAFLKPLRAILRKARDLDIVVFWGSADGWPDEPAEELDPEEIGFWAEGLCEEGFRLAWEVVADPDLPTEPDHVRLMAWETGHPAPPATEGWIVLHRAEVAA